MKIRTYTELSKFRTFKDRFEYLRLEGEIGADTFGFDRVFNQRFYRSREWKRLRDSIIIRDNGCDLGIHGHDILAQRIIIHHLNPISLKDIETCSDFLLNPEYLITTTHDTHNAIHYGDSSLLTNIPIERTLNDTCPWKR